MRHQPLGCDPGHKFIAGMGTLPPVEAERERDGILYVVGGRRGEMGLFGHGRTVAGLCERSKNIIRP